MQLGVACLFVSSLLAALWMPGSLAARLSQEEAVTAEKTALREELEEEIGEDALELDYDSHSASAEDELEEVDNEIVENSALCAESLVADACNVMDTSNNDQMVQIQELAFVTSSSIASIAAFYKSIGISEVEVPCDELCAAVVKSIPDGRRPPVSDMACRTGREGETPVVCDIDVSPAELSLYDFDEDHGEFEDGHEQEVPDGEAEDEPLDEESSSAFMLELTPAELTIFVANRFRIYPKIDVEVSVDVGDVDLVNETYTDTPADEASLSEMGLVGYCNSAICRQVSDCSKYPNSCSGCKACGGDKDPRAPRPTPSPTYYYEPAPSPAPAYYYNPAPSPAYYYNPSPTPTYYYNPAPSPTYYYNPAPSPTYYYDPAPSPPPTYYYNPAPSSTYYYNPSPSPTYYYGPAPSPPSPSPTPRPTQRPTPSPSLSVSSAPQWLQDVEKVSVKAQAYVAKALQAAPKSTPLLRKWFGRSDRKTTQKVMYVLNSLAAMLGNVAYKKGPKCGPNTYAYVYPRGSLSKNEKGQFVFYLCSVYFRSDLGEKIETLTHEGSHHALSYTDDVWADAGQTQKAYGRSTCKRLAQQYPSRAIKNADSHCYFINDVNGHSR